MHTHTFNSFGSGMNGLGNGARVGQTGPRYGEARRPAAPQSSTGADGSGRDREGYRGRERNAASSGAGRQGAGSGMGMSTKSPDSQPTPAARLQGHTDAGAMSPRNGTAGRMGGAQRELGRTTMDQNQSTPSRSTSSSRLTAAMASRSPRNTNPVPGVTSPKSPNSRGISRSPSTGNKNMRDKGRKTQSPSSASAFRSVIGNTTQKGLGQQPNSPPQPAPQVSSPQNPSLSSWAGLNTSMEGSAPTPPAATPNPLPNGAMGTSMAQGANSGTGPGGPGIAPLGGLMATSNPVGTHALGQLSMSNQLLGSHSAAPASAAGQSWARHGFGQGLDQSQQGGQQPQAGAPDAGNQPRTNPGNGASAPAAVPSINLARGGPAAGSSFSSPLGQTTSAPPAALSPPTSPPQTDYVKAAASLAGLNPSSVGSPQQPQNTSLSQFSAYSNPAANNSTFGRDPNTSASFTSPPAAPAAPPSYQASQPTAAAATPPSTTPVGVGGPGAPTTSQFPPPASTQGHKDLSKDDLMKLFSQAISDENYYCQVTELQQYRPYCEAFTKQLFTDINTYDSQFASLPPRERFQRLYNDKRTAWKEHNYLQRTGIRFLGYILDRMDESTA